MTVATSSPLSNASRRVVHLQAITLIWMSVEAILSLVTAWTSHSPALLAFGGDSLIELLSAAVVFWRFRFTLAEARAARIAGALLFALAGFVGLTSILNLIGHGEAHRSLVGRLGCSILNIYRCTARVPRGRFLALEGEGIT
jgi:divalent metal cation (Fe/Co/Zn/Cd) transporter